MVTKTKEKIEETTDNLVEKGLDKLQEKPVIEKEEIEAEVSKVEEEEEVEEAPAFTFQTQEDLDKHVDEQVKSLATSIANKSTATYQQQLEEIKKENRTLKTQVEDKQEDDALDRLDKAQKEEWGETKEVGEFQQAVRDLIKERRGFRQQIEEWQGKHEQATESARHVNAFTKALQLLLPEDQEEFIPALNELVTKLAGAETDRELDLIYALEEAKLKARAEAEPKPKRVRPDSNLPTAPGGVDLSKLVGEAAVAEGLKRLAKKQNT